ncbi:MAG: AMP-binding protein [Bilophila wadsworthia]
MCNWTSGAANFSHGLEAAGVRRVFTSSRLLDRLSGQGFPVGEHADVWVALEDAKRLSLPAKLGAFLKSRLLGIPCLGEAVIPRRVPETAAILFTSGSEALPKAVPLTHMNILANCRDIAAVLKITSHDSMLSMLPPFHSLGLTGNIALPLAFGLPAAYYANPTEGARLAALTRRWKPTITVAPPTFLDGMLRKARPGDLASLRLEFVGARSAPTACMRLCRAAPATSCAGYG